MFTMMPRKGFVTFFAVLAVLVFINAAYGQESSSKAAKGKAAVGKSVASKPEKQAARAAAPLATEQDPLAISKEWGQFVIRMKNLTTILTDVMKEVHESSKAASGNRTEYLLGIQQQFDNLYLDKFIVLLEPMETELKVNKAYQVGNPAVALLKIIDCIQYAKTSPSEPDGQGRLKWIEINSMAATVHHAFKKLSEHVDINGIEEADIFEIQYPSWLTDVSVKENADTFKDLNMTSIITYIDAQMGILGMPNNHLIRVLERLLNHTILNNWDPAATTLNSYCYGNNKDGQIHSRYDVLIDAAMYLCLADIKYTLMEVTYRVYKGWLGETNEGKPISDALGDGFHAEMENMKLRMENKYKISEGAVPDKAITYSPKVFKCDVPTPACVTDVPRYTSPFCPPGLYIQSGAVFLNSTPLASPSSPLERISLPTGEAVTCIGFEYVPKNSNGRIIPCEIRDGKCLDSKGQPRDDITITIGPVLLNEHGAPIYREPSGDTYEIPEEWGMTDCNIHPEAPPPDPRSGPSNTTGLPTDQVQETGYIDTRPPNLAYSAQFYGAFPAYVESELVLSPEGKCIGTCRDYKRLTPTCTNKTSHCDLFRQSHCEDKSQDCMRGSKCPNYARRCTRTSREIQACTGKEGLYEWLKINDTFKKLMIINSTEGEQPICSGDIYKMLERWEMESGVILNNPQYCELCMCVCNDPMSPAGRHSFDISERMTDVANGYVVTGLRFEQNNNTLYLNIQQGQLLPHGDINISTLAWLDWSREKAKLVPLGSYGFKRINIAEQLGGHDEVVTGLRWSQAGLSLNLEVSFTVFPHATAISATSPTRFAVVEKPVVDKLDLEEAFSPIKQEGPSQPFAMSDQLIEFDASSLEIDPGFTIPFIDLQPVHAWDGINNHTISPIAAVGVIFKSKKGSGGFIAPSLRTYVRSYDLQAKITLETIPPKPKKKKKKEFDFGEQEE